MVALHLVLGLQDGTGCLLSDGVTAPVEGQLSSPEPLPGGLPELEPETGVELPDADDRASARERAAASRLLEAILDGDGMNRIRDHLLRCQGRAEQEGTRLILAVDARTLPLRQLPWELLAALRQDDAPVWELRVARVVEGGVPAPRGDSASTLEVLGWCPDRSDPLCAGVARHLERSLSGIDQAVFSWFDPGSGVGTNLLEVPGRFRVLHVICHGDAGLAQVLLRLAPGQRASADTAARLLRSALDSARLVVLDVCGGAADARTLLDGPAARMLAAGARVCLGPRLAFAAEASQLFSSTFYRCLAGGAQLVSSVEAARSALACQLAVAHPFWRWWNPSLLVSHPSALEEPPPIEERPGIPGWPSGDRRLDPVMSRALELAGELGFLGVEQLGLALIEEGLVPGGRTELADVVGVIRRSLSYLRPRAQRPDRPRVTDRLRHMSGRMTDSFSPEMLGVAVFESPGIATLLGSELARRFAAGFAARVDPATVHTLMTAPTPPAGLSAHGAAALATVDPSQGLLLEVLAGPDDGMEVLLAEPGRVVGRWTPDHPPGASRQLYAPPRPDSNHISRRHIVYEGDWEISVHRRVTLTRDGRDEELRPHGGVPARVRLRDGDRITLRGAVHLAVHALIPEA